MIIQNTFKIGDIVSGLWNVMAISVDRGVAEVLIRTTTGQSYWMREADVQGVAPAATSTPPQRKTFIVGDRVVRSLVAVDCYHTTWYRADSGRIVYTVVWTRRGPEGDMEVMLKGRGWVWYPAVDFAQDSRLSSRQPAPFKVGDVVRWVCSQETVMSWSAVIPKDQYLLVTEVLNDSVMVSRLESPTSWVATSSRGVGPFTLNGPFKFYHLTLHESCEARNIRLARSQSGIRGEVR